VWDEFYGSGAKGKRKSDDADKDGKKGKGKGKGGSKDDGGDDALALLIQKRQRSREDGLSALEEKYRKIEEERAGKRAKKGKKADQENIDDGPPVSPPPWIIHMLAASSESQGCALTSSNLTMPTLKLSKPSCLQTSPNLPAARVKNLEREI
jgi:hypothetical protein